MARRKTNRIAQRLTTKLLMVGIGLLLPAFLSDNLLANTSSLPLTGRPEGDVTGFFRMLAGSGTTLENYADYHACSNPAYSKANFTEIDGTLGGETGTPAWVSASETEMPSLDFTRANKHFVKLTDNSASCTTGNDPWDFLGGNPSLFFIEAWVKPEGSLACADLGTKYTIISKWDDSTKCTYKMWLETVDSNGASCVAGDVEYALRAIWNDAGGTFSCGSPCEVQYPTHLVDRSANNGWVYVGFALDPAILFSASLTAINGRYGEKLGQVITCEDSTGIPNSFSADNNNQDVLIGIDVEGGSDGFEGKIASIKIGTSLNTESTKLLPQFQINHFDQGDFESPIIGGDGFRNQIAARRAYTKTPPPAETPTIPNFTEEARYGAAVNFDGVDDYASYVTSIFTEEREDGLLDGMMVEAWIRASDADGGGTKEQTIVSKWLYDNDASCTNNTSASSFRLFLDTSGKLNFEVMSASGSLVSETGNTVLADDTWYHVGGLVTTDTVAFLSASSVYVLVDGADDTGGSPTSFGSNNVNEVDTLVYLASTNVASPGTTCSDGVVKDLFEGQIDELQIAGFDSAQIAFEYLNPGYTINEVSFKATQEEVELYVFDGLNHTLDLDGHTLRLCSNATEDYVFDDACGNCASKVVDPGDIIKIIFDSTSPPADTSCQGAATTCTWYTGNGSGSNDLDQGDMVDTSDGVFTFARAVANANETYSALTDVVLWGTETAACNDTASNSARGNWQGDGVVSVGLITNSTKTLCLAHDGFNQNGGPDWRQCNNTIASLNSTAGTLVDLLAFEAVKQPTGNVLVSWQTAAEFETFGFHVEVSDFESGPFVRKSTEIILSKGSATSGALYEFTVSEGVELTKFVRLVEIENNGIENIYGPVQVVDSATAKIGPDSSEETPTSSSQPSSIATNETSTEPTINTPQTKGGGGCAQIVSSEQAASPTLLLIMLIVIFLSTRTFWIIRISSLTPGKKSRD